MVKASDAQSKDIPAAQLFMFSRDDIPSHRQDGGVSVRTRLVDGDDTYQELIYALNHANRIALISKTNGTSPHWSRLEGIAFCVAEGEGWYLPCVSYDPASEQEFWCVDPQSSQFVPVILALQRPSVELVAHNAKADINAFRGAGIKLEKLIHDTMIAHLLCGHGLSSSGLAKMTALHLGWRLDEDIETILGRNNYQATCYTMDAAQAANWASLAANAVYCLHDVLTQGLNDRKQADFFYRVESPLVAVLADMETTGVAIDMAYMRALAAEVDEEISELTKRIYSLAGAVFNINSNKQTNNILLTKLRSSHDDEAPRPSNRGTTATNLLNDWLNHHEIVPLIIKHRRLSKLRKMYIGKILQMANPETARVHIHFNQIGTPSGQITSSGPDPQTISSKIETSRRILRAFIAHGSNQLIGARYSELEMRILAHLSNEPRMLDAFGNDEDIHTAIAAFIYDIHPYEVTAMQRSNVRRINTGIVYGINAKALARQTGMTYAEAQAFIDLYFKKFPRVYTWVEGARRFFAEHGYTETILGRRIYAQGLQLQKTAPATNPHLEREAVKYCVQGTAADIMKIAILNVHRRLRDGGYGAKIVLQTHDALVIDSPVAEAPMVLNMVKREMESACRLNVPLRVCVDIGKNLADLKSSLTSPRNNVERPAHQGIPFGFTNPTARGISKPLKFSSSCVFLC